MDNLLRLALLIISVISCSTLARPHCDEVVDVHIEGIVTAAGCTAQTQPALGASAPGLAPSALTHFKCADDIVISIAIVNEADARLFAMISGDEDAEVVVRCIMTEKGDAPYTVFMKKSAARQQPGKPT